MMSATWFFCIVYHDGSPSTRLCVLDDAENNYLIIISILEKIDGKAMVA